jgi:hypothetical protein
MACRAIKRQRDDDDEDVNYATPRTLFLILRFFFSHYDFLRLFLCPLFGCLFFSLKFKKETLVEGHSTSHTPFLCTGHA